MDPQQNDPLETGGFAKLFERSALPTIAIDHERREVIRANAAALDFLGLAASQVLGRPANDFLREPTPDQLREIRLLRGEETAGIRRVPTALGVRTVELNIVASGVDGIAFLEAIDLTELLEAAARAEELAKTSAALRTVAARLAHDLAGPMAAISGFSDLLIREGNALDDAQRTSILQRVSATVHALSAMTTSILGEADTGAARPEDASHDVEDLFRALRGVTEAQIIDCDGALETTTDVATLPVPVGAVRQPVINLVSNSIKYRDPSRALRVQVDVRSARGGIEITVRDNGKGFSEDPAKLFEAGRRGSGATNTAGAGLGLAFAQAGVETVGGRMTARSLSDGAEFVIMLPALTDAADADESGGEVDEVDGEAREEALAPGFTAAQLERIVDASPVATLVIDIALRQIVHLNRAALELVGLPAEEVLGRPGSDFVDGQAIAEAIRRRVLDQPDAKHAIKADLRTARGQTPTYVWIAAVEGTALAVAQVVDDDALGVDTPA